MRATIKDVAKLAGVSTATVSNVLTGRKNVSESLRRRVNEASAELDYKPNSIARSLKTGIFFYFKTPARSVSKMQMQTVQFIENRFIMIVARESIFLL